MSQNAAFQTDDLDAFDSDCDEAPGASAAFMVHLSSDDSDVILEVPNSDNYQDNNVHDMSVPEEPYSEQISFNPNPDVEITSDSNIISYAQYLQETKSTTVQISTSTEEQNAMIMSVFDALSEQVAKCTADNLKHKELDASLTVELEKSQMNDMILRKNAEFADFQKEINTLKKQAFWLILSNPISEQLVVQSTTVKTEAPSELPKELFKDFDKGLNLEINEVKMVCNQMEAAVEQCSVDKKYSEPEKKELLLENDCLLEHIISVINDYKSMENSYVDEYTENLKLQAELTKMNDKVEKSAYNELFKKCSGLENQSNVIPSKVYQLDFPPLSPRLKNNRVAHVDYRKVTQEHTYTLCDIVKRARAIHPLDNEINYACQVSSSTEACGSKPRSNTRNNKISQTSNSNNNKKKNKVEDQHRISKSSLNMKNHVSTSIYNESVKQFVLNANFELIYVTFHECMFDVVHDSCVVDFINNVNVNGKSKFVNAKSGRRNKKKVWKPTGKVFTSVGHRWLTTGKTFTIDGNKCPLTRITSTTTVPPKKNVQPKPNTNVPNPKVKVFYRSTKNDTHSILGPRPSNIKEPNQSIFGHLNSPMLGNVTISRVYYVEGLRHNLISVGKFCDTDLEAAFRKHTCFVRDLEGVEIIYGSRGINLYTISLDDMLKSSLICLLSKASKTKSWL
ncbi:hypothetical protein Tco_1533821 [Tanacetum coccineum]